MSIIYKKNHILETYGMYDNYRNLWVWTGSRQDFTRKLILENDDLNDKKNLTFSGVYLHKEVDFSGNDTYLFQTVDYVDEDGVWHFNKKYFLKRYTFHKEDWRGNMSIVNPLDRVREILMLGVPYINRLYYRKHVPAWENPETFRKQPVPHTGRKGSYSNYYRRPSRAGYRKTLIVDEDEQQYVKRPKPNKYYMGWWDDYPRSNAHSRSWKNQKIRRQWQKKTGS